MTTRFGALVQLTLMIEVDFKEDKGGVIPNSTMNRAINQLLDELSMITHSSDLRAQILLMKREDIALFPMPTEVKYDDQN